MLILILMSPQAQQFLDSQGAHSTLDYVRALTEMVNRETRLFPHANPGLLDDTAQAALRPSNPSMGLMLENISPRLMEPGMPHHNCPDKEPSLRVETIAASGRQRVPFTTGILVGIGEKPGEVVDSLFALADLAQRYGSIQEVIVQNFRAKADTRMRRDAEPTVQYFARVVAIARWILGPAMNLRDVGAAGSLGTQRLGRSLPTDDRLGESRGALAPPREIAQCHRRGRVPPAASAAGLPGVHQRRLD